MRIGNILAIESSGLVAGCAYLRDGVLAAEYSLQSSAATLRKTHSQSLMPMLEQMRDMLALDLSETDAIAVTAGPGSFTGLRIGAATAKGLGMALNKPLIPVSTLASLAWNAAGAGTDLLLCPVMDARRQQVYTGGYRFDRKSGRLLSEREDRTAEIRNLLQELSAAGEEVLFLGDGVPVYEETIREMLKEKAHFAPPHLSRQRAASTATLAAALVAEKGEAALVKAEDFRPTYLRLSQAERERMAAEASAKEET